jgi:hypothetical protein
MGQVNAESGMLANMDLNSNTEDKNTKNESKNTSKSGSKTPIISSSGVPFPSTSNASISPQPTTTSSTSSNQNGENSSTSSNQNTGNSSKSSNQNGENSTETATETNSGNEVGTTITMTTDANNDKGSSKGKGNSKSNPVIISSDLTSAQNMDRSFTPIINVGMSKSSMIGTSSWGLNSMIWFNFKQFAVTGRYTKIQFSKNRKLKLIHNVNLTGVYSYGNLMSFLGYSAILNAGKFGITGANISGSITKSPEDMNLYLSPAVTAFYTKPIKINKKMIISPELYVISTPLIYSSVDKVSVSDRTFSMFIGSSVDYQFSKRFKVNMNYKLNTSTNPNFPVLSFFLIGSKINL